MKYETITEKRFKDLFGTSISNENRFGITAVLSNVKQVFFDKSPNIKRFRGLVSFYEQGLDKGGNYVMKLVFRTKDYKKLKDYLKKIDEDYRIKE